MEWQKFLFIFHCSLICCCGIHVDNVNEETFSIRRLLTRTFFSEKSLLLICDDNDDSQVHVYQLFSQTLNFVTFSLQNLIKNKVLLTNTKFDSYVIVSQDLGLLRELFEFYEFEPHRQILIFSELNYRRYPFNYLTKMRGLDIIFVKGISGIFTQTAQKQMKQNGGVKVESVYKNKVILQWTPSHGVTLDEADLRLGKWRPNFELVGDMKEQGGHGINADIISIVARDWPVEFVYFEKESINKQLNSHEYDTVICPFDVTNIHEVSISTAYWYENEGFVVPVVKQTGYTAFVFYPFDTTVWITVILADVITGGLLHLIFERNCVDVTLSLNLYTSLGDHSSNVVPKNGYSSQKRSIYTIWGILCVILSTAYSAGLSTAMNIPRYPKPIRSMADMLERNIKWAYTSDSGIPKYIINSKVEIIKKLLPLGVEFSSDAEFRMAIRNGDMAIPVTLFPNGQLSITFEPDDFMVNNLHVLQQYVFVQPRFFPFPKHSPFRKVFNERLYSIVECGHLYSLSQKLRYRPTHTKHLELVYDFRPEFQPGVNKMNMAMLQCSFYLLLIGHVLASVSFLIEIFYRKCLRLSSLVRLAYANID